MEVTLADLEQIDQELADYDGLLTLDELIEYENWLARLARDEIDMELDYSYEPW